MYLILKRDGTIVPFEKDNIIRAINGAMREVDGQIYEYDTARDIACDIENDIVQIYEERSASKIPSRGMVTVEEIQDMVEDYLMRSERRDVARAYIRFRYKKEVARDVRGDFFEPIEEKLTARNVKNQNANVDERSFGGRIGEAASYMTKEYALKYLISEKARNNHLNNRIYIHDLDHYAVGSHNCLSIPFDDLLANGFNTRQADIRPANSINTAFQLVAVIFQLQSLCQFGGVSASHIDWTMVPYVRKSFTKHLGDGLKYVEQKSDYKTERFKKWVNYHSKDGTIHFDDVDFKFTHPEAWEYAMEMTEKETMQAVEAMYHNLNTLQSRSGNQLPFTSINYGTCTLSEGKLVTRCLIEGSIKGIGKLHKTSIFPCGIFQCMKGVNREPGDPNYDLFRLALKSTAQRLYPNYANVDWSGNAGYDINDPRTYFSTMGCRTANGWDVNGLGQLKDGRGNICPTTIILPTIAMEACELNAHHMNDFAHPEGWDESNYDVVETFLYLLDQAIHDAKDMLIERFEWICSQSPASARFMYENGLMAGYVPEEGIRSALKHGTLALGQLGLAEALQILIDEDHTSPEGMALAKRIEALFKKRCAEFKEEYKLNFGVYYTPAENLCHTALEKFKEKYGVLEDISDKDFFTNSMHVPVWKEMSPFEKIDIESQLTGYSSAGCITYVELDSGIKNNLDALETLVNYAMDKDIPYFAVNVPNDTCLTCGYCDEFNDHCPECGSTDIQQLRRVTGYLTGNYTTAFNKGKQDEVRHRVKHK